MLKLQIKKIKDSRGYTLIELLLTMGLILVVVSLVSAAYFLSANTSRDVINIATSEIDSRLIMYRITKDVRESVEISEAEASSITFKSNVDDDDDYEVLSYYLEAEDGYYTLSRRVGSENAHVVASKIINNNIFTYYTDIDTPENGMTTVSEEELGNIKIIKIDLNIDQEGAESSRTMELKTHVTLRNRV